MNLAIVIPTYKRPEALKECFASILAQSEIPSQIIIVDDGETDLLTVHLFENMCLVKGIDFQYLKKDHALYRRGLSESKNLSLDLVVSDLVLFLDDDVVLGSRFVEKVLVVWRDDASKQLFGVGGVIEDSRSKSLFEKIFNQLFGLMSKSEWDITDVGYQVWNDLLKIRAKGYYTHGGLTCYRVDLLRQFRFQTFMGGRTGLEDVELCFRVKQKEYYFIIEPLARAKHNHVRGEGESEFLAGYKESKNRKVFFHDLVAPSVFHSVRFFWSSVGWILRQFLVGHFQKSFGMIIGFIK